MSEFATAYPNSRKVLVDGARASACRCARSRCRAASRRSACTTRAVRRTYDVAEGLPKLREPWVAPRRAASANGGPVTQLHYARKGEITAGDGVHRGPRRAAGRLRPRRGRARPRHHPGEHQPSRARADDHRPQLPREDQREHRQLGGVLVDRGGGREAAVGDALGRRHGDGPLDGQEHPRDARVDHPQLRRADRHGADLSGAREGRRPSGGSHAGRSIATRSSSSASRAWTTSRSTPACCCATSR